MVNRYVFGTLAMVALTLLAAAIYEGSQLTEYEPGYGYSAASHNDTVYILAQDYRHLRSDLRLMTFDSSGKAVFNDLVYQGRKDSLSPRLSIVDGEPCAVWLAAEPGDRTGDILLSRVSRDGLEPTVLASEGCKFPRSAGGNGLVVIYERNGEIFFGSGPLAEMTNGSIRFESMIMTNGSCSALELVGSESHLFVVWAEQGGGGSLKIMTFNITGEGLISLSPPGDLAGVILAEGTGEIVSLHAAAQGDRCLISFAARMSEGESELRTRVFGMEHRAGMNVTPPAALSSGESTARETFSVYLDGHRHVIWTDNEIYLGPLRRNSTTKKAELYTAELIEGKPPAPVMLTPEDDELSFLGRVVFTEGGAFLLWYDFSDGYNIHYARYSGNSISGEKDITGNTFPGMLWTMIFSMGSVFAVTVPIMISKFRSVKKKSDSSPGIPKNAMDLKFVSYGDLRRYLFLKWFFLVAGGLFIAFFMMDTIQGIGGIQEAVEPGFRSFPLGIFLILVVMVMGTVCLYLLRAERNITGNHSNAYNVLRSSVITAGVGAASFIGLQYLGWGHQLLGTLLIFITSYLSYCLLLGGTAYMVYAVTNSKMVRYLPFTLLFAMAALVYSIWKFTAATHLPGMRSPMYIIYLTPSMSLMVNSLLVSIFFVMMLFRSLGKEAVKKISTWTRADLDRLRMKALVFVAIAGGLLLALDIYLLIDISPGFHFDSSIMVFGFIILVPMAMLFFMWKMMMKEEVAKQKFATAPTAYTFGGYALPLVNLVLVLVLSLSFSFIGALGGIALFVYQVYTFDHFLRTKGMEYIGSSEEVLDSEKEKELAQKRTFSAGKEFTRAEVRRYIESNENMALVFHGFGILGLSILMSSGIGKITYGKIMGSHIWTLELGVLLAVGGLVIYNACNYRRMKRAGNLVEMMKGYSTMGLEIIGYVLTLFLILFGGGVFIFIMIMGLCVLGGILSLLIVYNARRLNDRLPREVYTIKGESAVRLAAYIEMLRAREGAAAPGAVKTKEEGKDRPKDERGIGEKSDMIPAVGGIGVDRRAAGSSTDRKKRTQKLKEGELGKLLSEEPREVFEKRQKQFRIMGIVLLAIALPLGGLFAASMALGGSISLSSPTSFIWLLFPLMIIPLFLLLGLAMTFGAKKIKPIRFHENGTYATNLLGKDLLIPYGNITKYTIMVTPKGRRLQGTHTGGQIIINLWDGLDEHLGLIEERMGDRNYRFERPPSSEEKRIREGLLYFLALPLGVCVSALFLITGNRDNSLWIILGLLPLGTALALGTIMRFYGRFHLAKNGIKPDPRVFFTVLVVAIVLGIFSWSAVSPREYIVMENDMHMTDASELRYPMERAGMLNDTVLYLEESLVVRDELLIVNSTVIFNCTAPAQYALYVHETGRLIVRNSTIMGSYGDRGMSFEVYGELRAENSSFEHLFGDPDNENGQGGIEFYSAGGEFRNCSFKNCSGGSVVEFDSSLAFHDCVFEDIGDEGVEVNGGRAVLHNCSFERVEWGVGSFAGAGTETYGCDFTDCRHAVWSSAGCNLRIEDCSFEDCGKAVSVRGSDELVIKGATFSGCDTDVERNPFSPLDYVCTALILVPLAYPVVMFFVIRKNA